MNEKMCGCGHHKIMPILVVLFGLLFLLNNMGSISDKTTMLAWPIIVILAGLMKLFKGLCGCCK